ncbi:hypothetical protein [Texcoconibacillus texcoconensis]|uniref:Uncharacterized protein n=1 Tax=Texcoconibacillus texcoconensis TaxID=1095777 RepID=A0A840QR99_9BACI|nr:hypothetical protein [Texcoconibacillus texcoconensis]MBB5173879.1 hypothetical protein [Texcoconibacillus texcoconensis]
MLWLNMRSLNFRTRLFYPPTANTATAEKNSLEFGMMHDEGNVFEGLFWGTLLSIPLWLMILGLVKALL